MSIRDTLFSFPCDKVNDWIFDEHVAKVFPDMIQRSIPGYLNIISMIGIIAQHFVTPNTKVYDLGCALGAVTLSIQKNIKVTGCNIISVDKSSAMVHLFRQNIKNIDNDTKIEVIESDIQDISIKNASMVVLNFTLQFLKPDERLKVLTKIYNGLRRNGILILSEKLIFEDSYISKLLCNVHYSFKRTNGYSNLEINQKHRMLKNVMLIDSIETHKARLKKVGFKKVDMWFQCLNFGSLLALKTSI